MDDDGENQFQFSDDEEEEEEEDDYQELNKMKKKKKKKKIKIPVINKRSAAMKVGHNSSSSSSSMEKKNNNSLLRLKFIIPSITNSNSPSTECSGDEGTALLFPHQTNSPSGPQVLPDAAEQQEIRVCRICKKGFPSGRALGGHMRIHNKTTHDDDEDEFPKKLPNPNKQLKKQLKASALLALSNNAASLAATGEEEPTTVNCAICNKTFPSIKSLFGHMRCHPNRQWRGILPPPPNASTKNSPSTNVSDSLGCHKMEDQINSAAATPTLAIGSSSQSVGPVRALPRWSVKAKRGRAANTNANQDIPEAAYDLMMLSRGESLDSDLSNFKQRSYDELDNIKKRSSEESETGNFNSRDLIIRKPEMCSGYSRKRKKSYSDGSEGEQEEDGDYNDTEKPLPETELDDGSLVLAKMKLKMKKKKKKKLNLRDLERVDNMSGVNVMNEYKQSQSQHLHKISADRYKCTTCNKSYPSHQALGGHRSSHYKVKTSPSLHPQDEFAFGSAQAPAEEEEEEMEMEMEMEMEEDDSVEEHYGVVPFPNTTNLAQFNDPTEYDILGSNSSLVSGTASTHRCQICNRTFPTGQALGGHKRCHWTPVEVHPNSLTLQFHEEAPASKAATCLGTGRRMLAFDLNDLPTTTAEGSDEEVEGGMKQITIVDYASSSENSAN